MTREAFIRKWLGNTQKQYNEQCRDEMRDDLDVLIQNDHSAPAYAVYADSIQYGLSDTNTLMAIFRLEEHAKIFGRKMWGRLGVIKPIMSEHFR